MVNHLGEALVLGLLGHIPAPFERIRGGALVLGLNDANKVAIAAGVRSCSRVKR